MNMKYIRYLSDIHLDHDYRNNKYVPKLWRPAGMPEDLDTCLVIAGDLWTDLKFFKQNEESWLALVAKQFKYVVIVLGNHDYWDSNIDTIHERANKLLANKDLYPNVHLLEIGSVVLDQVKFVGGTLWTDYGNNNPLSKLQAVNYMNDYRKIKKSVPDLDSYFSLSYKVTPDYLHKIFNKTKKFLFDNEKDYEDQVLGAMCVTATSTMSVNAKYCNKQDIIANTWYYSQLDYSIMDSQYDYWIHGHMHDPVEYMLGKCKVMCNPRGYTGYEQTNYNEKARIEL